MNNDTNSLMAMIKNPQKIYSSCIDIKKRVTDLEPRLLLLILLPLSLLIFLTLSSTNPLSFFTPLKSYICSPAPIHPSLAVNYVQQSALRETAQLTAKLTESRIAVCLVGGARRFELTGPSIVKRILKVYPNSDLFVHSPLDENSFKFSLLKISPRIAAVRVFRAARMPETEAAVRVLTAANSPNGIQGLLQYFNLVEGCLTMIKSYQKKNNFTYDWIVRTRVDGYWSAPLDPKNFAPGRYIVPPGSTYGGLNDRFGVGDFNTSVVALSRLSLIPLLNSSGFTQLNSETAFKAQLTTNKVPYSTKRLPFCVVSDRRYEFPPTHFGVPVAAIASRGPLSGAKCRPCRAVCSGPSVGNVMARLDKGWSWTEWANGTMDLCDAHGEWEKGWEKLFDAAAGKKLASARVRVGVLDVEHCVADFEEMRRKTAVWEAPEPVEICKLGLGSE